MSDLKTVTDLVISDFISQEVLFTALDVSNKVKETLPFARHREVRDQVRQAWANDIEPKGYGRSPITVNLSDGSTADALLYHPLTDSWDLDSKYDSQQRAKTANRPATAAPTPVTTATHNINVSNNGSIVITPQPATPVVPAAPVNAKDLWNNMFNSQPSLFPRK